MTDKPNSSPSSTPSKSDSKEDSQKDSPSPQINRNVEELRDQKDLLGWLDDSTPNLKSNKQKKQVANQRRRTTIIDKQVPKELADIIGKGQWVEAPTPEQVKQIQSTTPAALKYMIDLVSSLSSAQTSSIVSTSPSSSSLSSPSSSASTESTRDELTPEIIQQRIADTRRLFLEPVLAELEAHQLKFALIILFFVIILIHIAVSMFGNN